MQEIINKYKKKLRLVNIFGACGTITGIVIFIGSIFFIFVEMFSENDFRFFFGTLTGSLWGMLVGVIISIVFGAVWATLRSKISNQKWDEYMEQALKEDYAFYLNGKKIENPENLNFDSYSIQIKFSKKKVLLGPKEPKSEDHYYPMPIIMK